MHTYILCEMLFMESIIIVSLNQFKHLMISVHWLEHFFLNQNISVVWFWTIWYWNPRSQDNNRTYLDIWSMPHNSRSIPRPASLCRYTDPQVHTRHSRSVGTDRSTPLLAQRHRQLESEPMCDGREMVPLCLKA